jgi:hypothetical protein
MNEWKFTTFLLKTELSTSSISIGRVTVCISRDIILDTLDLQSTHSWENYRHKAATSMLELNYPFVLVGRLSGQ